jgi:hypothetical protein
MDIENACGISLARVFFSTLGAGGTFNEATPMKLAFTLPATIILMCIVPSTTAK